MIILFAKTQQSLFDAPVHVAAHVRKDGVVVAPHVRIQKVAFKQPSLFDGGHADVPPPSPRKTKLDGFIAKHGGLRALGVTLSGLTYGQREAIYAQMASVSGQSVAEISTMFATAHVAPEPAPAASNVVDLFSHAPAPRPVEAPEPVAAKIITHTTTKGKTLRGVVRMDLDKEQAIKIDAFTFRKDGGWFIRERHLVAVNASKAKTKPEPVETATAPEPEPASAPVPTPVPARAEKPAPLFAPAHDSAAPFGVPAGISKPKRRELNASVASRLVDGGPYSETDLALFRQYSGNGGCGDSLNEYYTDPDVTRGMWSAIAALGVTGGTALEPSCGTGVFMHTAPAGFRVTGVELDAISAGVASALHGDRHEIHTAGLERFATSDDRQFDVVIGNPPYGPRGYLAKDDKKEISTCEQYFVDTSLDKCKPGGIVALVVPTGIMDSKSARSFRESMLRKGEFLGAQRMPNTAFEHSHTAVTTDVIYLRKRPDAVAGALGTVDQATLKSLGVWDDEFLAGSYFTGRGADNVLGTMTDGWRAKAGMGHDITVEGSMDGVAAAIAGFKQDGASVPATAVTMDQVLNALGDDEKGKARAISAGFRRPYSNTAQVGDTKMVDGVEYVLQGNPPRWHLVSEFMQDEAISDAQRVAADIDRLMAGSGGVDRPALERAVRQYVKDHGVPADNPALMTAARVDKTLFRLVGAVNRKGELSDAIMGKAARKIEGGFDATAQILALQNGEFTASNLSERIGTPLDDVTDQLTADPRYASTGAGKWAPMDVYLTGELWPKLDVARSALNANSNPELADKLRMQIDRLEKTIDPRVLDDVDFQINSAFIPLRIVEAFVNWELHDAPAANEWTKKQDRAKITFSDGVYALSGGNPYGRMKLLGKYLNRTGVRKDEQGDIQLMNEAFKAWLCSSEYRDEVEDIYNRAFRGFVAPEYSNEPIDVPGLATDRTVRDWRWSSLRRSLATGKGIIADDVGLGKTLGGLLLARMSIVQGSAKKPIIVVPKSVLANWYDESQTWFPGSRVLTIGANFSKGKNGELVGKDDKADERKRKYHDLTQNDYDFILISEPAFEELDLDPVKKEEYYSRDFWVQRGDSMGSAGDKRRVAIRENYEQALAKREFSDRTDAIYFNDLGIDMLIADEMHHQKNLYAAKNRFGESPKFLGGQGLSNRALDFTLKARFVRDSNGGKNVHGLTATPTKNSPLEIYSMLSHIAPEAFEQIGVRNSEEFLDRFCEFENDQILTTSGEIEEALVTVGFKNMNELREIMSRYIDRRTADMVGLKLPNRNDKMHIVDMNLAQKQAYEELRALAESSGGKDATGDSHIFSIMDKMNKAALDLTLLDPEAYAGAKSPKYAELAKQCLEGAKDGGQIVFSEYVDSHESIVAALVDAGFKRSEIGVINAKVASSSIKRQNIAEALNAGKLKVVVGNCTMAEGLNMQKTTTDIHHMDVPWEPATLQQRNGRGLRQGNMNESLRIHTYLSRGSFDGYRYQSVAAKKGWQDLIWSGGDRFENLAREGAFSVDDIRIMMSADPDAARAAFDANKTEATLRFEAGKRIDAQSQYVKFVELSTNFKSLKNKETTTAARLRLKLDTMKTALTNNKNWENKRSLDTLEQVLMHPQTGAILAKDQGMNVPEHGKMVVTDVDMRSGMVALRPYGSVASSWPIFLKLKDISNAKPFKFDADEEAKEVGDAMESAAVGKVNNLEGWNDVKAMPSRVLEANHDAIQRQIKDGSKSYKFQMPYGDVAMVDKETGKIKLAKNYEHLKMHDTHDYLLPTDDGKEKATQEWMDALRNSNLGIESVEQGRGRGNYTTIGRRKFAGSSYDQPNVNPFTQVLSNMTNTKNSRGVSTDALKDIKKKFQDEQQDRIRRAINVPSALEAILPLAEVSSADGHHKAVYPERALALLWARVRHFDALGRAAKPLRTGKHSPYAYGQTYKNDADDLTMHATIMNMAATSGHDALLDAIAEHGERLDSKLPAEQVLHALSGAKTTKRRLNLMLRVAERGGIADHNIREFSLLNEFRSLSYGGVTVRERIEKLLDSAK